MEEEIKEILKTANVTSHTVSNGYDKDGFLVPRYELYFDPYNHDWRDKESALVGYVLKQLVPTIRKVIQDGNKV